MTLKSIPFGLLLILIVHIAPKPEGPCSWSCHNDACYHGQELALGWLDKLGLDESIYYEKMEPVYLSVIHWLHDLPGTYREANLYIYGLALPALAFLLALLIGVRWPWMVVAGVGSVLFAMLPDWYDLCTEFCIYVGNWTGLTYAGFNFILFLILIPGFLLVDLFLAFRRLYWDARRYCLEAAGYKPLPD